MMIMMVLKNQDERMTTMIPISTVIHSSMATVMMQMASELKKITSFRETILINVLASTFDPDIPNAELNDNDEEHFKSDPMPATNSGEFAHDVHDEMIKSGNFGDMVISGQVILNQCGTLLTRKKRQIKGSIRDNLFLQQACATTIGSSIPLLHHEAMIFLSIHWKMDDDSG